MKGIVHSKTSTIYKRFNLGVGGDLARLIRREIDGMSTVCCACRRIYVIDVIDYVDESGQP